MGGRPLALGTMLQSSIFHAMARITHDTPFTKANGSLWVVQLWLFAYFPVLVSPDSERLPL